MTDNPGVKPSETRVEDVEIIRRERVLRREVQALSQVEERKAAPEETNVLTQVESVIDGRLNILQRLLSEQLSQRRNVAAADGSRSSLRSTLSGAKASHVGRRHMEDSLKPSHPKKTKKESNRLNASNSLDRIRSAVETAEGLGIDVGPAVKKLDGASVAFHKSKYGESLTLISQAEKNLTKLASSEAPQVLKDIRRRIRVLRKVNLSYRPPRDLIISTKENMEARHWIAALGALGALRTSVQNAEHGVVLNLVLASKPRLMLAKRAGLDVEGAVALLSRSRHLLMKGDLEGAVRLAQESRRAIDLLLKAHQERSALLSESTKTLTIADCLDIDTSSFRIRLAGARSKEDLQKLLVEAKATLNERLISSMHLAEKSLADAHEAGAEVSLPEATLGKARDALVRNEFINCLVLAGSSMLQSNEAYIKSLNERLKSIDQFTRNIDGEVESLTEVQDAITHSKEKSLEEFRRHAQMSEDLVRQAFDSAVAYTRVSQDIVKEAFENSVSMNPSYESGGERIETLREPSLTIEDKRLRIADLCQSGRITEAQRERLLSLIDLSETKANLV